MTRRALNGHRYRGHSPYSNCLGRCGVGVAEACRRFPATGEGVLRRLENSGRLVIVLFGVSLSKSRAILWATSALVSVAALLCVGGAILCEAALRVPRSLRIEPDDQLAAGLAARTRSHWQLAVLRARDGIPLRAWLFVPERSNGSGAILLHGVADTRRGVLAHAEYLLRAGYVVLTPDSRGHGVSGGDLITYGVRECSDVALWAKWMRGKADVARLYGLGESMGAAILLQSVDELDAVVAEASFATFRQVAQYRVAEKIGVREWMAAPVVECGLMYAWARYGLDLGTASPLEHVRKTRVPVLLIQGLADRNVPLAQARELAFSNPRVALWLVPGAGHTEAFASQPAETERRVLGWFRSPSHLE
jgi:uncharacterized protein